MKRRRFDPAALPGWAGAAVDTRLRVATPLRRLFNRVFPDHWSFLLGQIVLSSFVVLLLTGVFLTLFFEPSMREVVYDGSYPPLSGTRMSAAYESTVDISFDVRGGLLIRQMHHWAALLLMASLVAHLLRMFVTGAFRKPRELNWVIGWLLFWTGLLTGYTGYTLIDDALSATSLRIASGIIMSIPVAGTWLASAIFGGEYPGDVIIGRLSVVHILLLPAVLTVLIAGYVVLVVRQRPAQWPGPGRTNLNIVGERLVPRYAMKQAALFTVVSGVIALLGGLLQINPIWLYGPSRAAVAAASSQPAWYIMFLDGAVRLMPPWEVHIPIGDGYVIQPTFWAAVALPAVLVALPMLYPFIEARRRRDHREHHLLQRPRDAPARTALAGAAVTFAAVLTLAGAADIIATQFHISVNAITWAGRIGVLLLPPAAYTITYRICLGLQQHDRQVLTHGVETGIIRRLPDGGYAEIHQPLTAAPPRHTGWAIPKKMNRLGALPPPGKGFFKPVEPPAQPPVSRGLPPRAP